MNTHLKVYNRNFKKPKSIFKIIIPKDQLIKKLKYKNNSLYQIKMCLMLLSNLRNHKNKGFKIL